MTLTFYSKVDRFETYSNLDSKVIALIWNFRCYLHIMGNHCAKYEQARSKNERGVCITDRRQVLSKFDLDLCLKGHIHIPRPLL